MITVALVAIVKPNVDTISAKEKWQDFVEVLLQKISKYENVSILNETLLQIPLNDGLQLLAEVVHTCKVEGYQSKTLFFEEEPKWITS